MVVDLDKKFIILSGDKLIKLIEEAETMSRLPENYSHQVLFWAAKYTPILRGQCERFKIDSGKYYTLELYEMTYSVYLKNRNCNSYGISNLGELKTNSNIKQNIEAIELFGDRLDTFQVNYIKEHLGEDFTDFYIKEFT